MKVLAITHLFGVPWDTPRGIYNQQQFDRLAQRVDFKALVGVPWVEALRRPRQCWTARREGRKRWPYVDYFIVFYPPGVGRSLHALCFLLSVLVQRPITVLFRRWHVLIGSWAYPDSVAVAALGILRETPVLMKVHGTDVNDYLNVRGKRWQIMAAARRCRAVMSAGAALGKKLVDAGLPAERLVVCYDGVDQARFKPREQNEARRSLGLAPGRKWLLFVGHLKVTKGVVDLLHAFAAFAASDPDAMLLYIGEGDARPRLEEIIRQGGLGERVRLLGKLEHSDLPQWFNAADLLCLPSHNEGVPNVVLEAMSSGIPVIATRVGGIPEIVPECAGELVDKGDIAALAAALQRALGRAWDGAQIAEHARQFDWDRNVDNLQALLEKVAR